MKFAEYSLILVFLAACSASVDAPAPSATIPLGETPIAKIDEGIEGPDISGEWVTQCQTSLSNSSRLYLKFEDKSFKRSFESFSDKNCKNLEFQQGIEGNFIFINKNNEFWELEYRIPFSNEGTEGYSIQYENIQLGEDVIYTSNMVGGDAAPQLTRPLYAIDKLPEPQKEVLTPIADHSPKYGQYIKYEGTANGTFQTEEYSNQGYFSEYGTWTVYYKIDGSSLSMGYNYYKDLWSTAKYNELMENCADDGGTEEVITIKAGTFKTCKMETTNYILWKGNLPIFENIKIKKKDGTYQSEVTKFSL